MEVGNCFAGVGAVIDDQPIPCFVEAGLAGDALGGCEKVGEERVVFGGDGSVAGVVFFGDEQDVSGCLGSEVAEGEDMFVLVKDVGLSFAVDDLFEDRFSHGNYQMVSSSREGLKVRARARMKWTISSLRCWQELRHEAEPVRERTQARRPSRRRAEAREETFSSTRVASC